MRSDRKRAPVLITDAAEDPEKELRHREIRYVIMMMVRAGCLVLGAVIVSTRPWLWPLWLVLCVIGAVVLPWLAVVLANDRPPKSKAERLAARHGYSTPQQALPSVTPDRVIDADGYPADAPSDRRAGTE